MVSSPERQHGPITTRFALFLGRMTLLVRAIRKNRTVPRLFAALFGRVEIQKSENRKPNHRSAHVPSRHVGARHALKKNGRNFKV
mgnify:CR=1 FL=1